MSRLVLFFIISITSLLHFSCRSRDQKNRVAIPAEALFMDYVLSAEEGDDKLTLKVRFLDEEDGEVFALPANSDLFLDAVPVPADSTKGSGVFYELHPDMAVFEGSHSLFVRSGNKTLIADSFAFHRIVPETAIPDTITRGDFTIRLSGLENEDYIRVIATDTVFSNAGINRLDTITGGELVISKADWDQLAAGPVQLLLVRENEGYLEGEKYPVGRRSLVYMLKKEVFLKD